MNSALRCLFHTPQLVDYFLKDFSDDINMDNLLGMKGELALSFGNLLRKLRESGRRPLAPRLFKLKLRRFVPQFSGYNQHDSQELLAFLLDGLHEDLNRVKQKPYVERKNFGDRPYNKIAEDLWKYHQARNDSIIVDTCQMSKGWKMPITKATMTSTSIVWTGCIPLSGRRSSSCRYRCHTRRKSWFPVVQIQKFRTTVEDLHEEITHIRENKQHEDNDTTGIKSEVRPLYKHLKEIEAELTIWMENSTLLKEELERRFTLCDIQEKITVALIGSVKKYDIIFTNHQILEMEANDAGSDEINSNVDQSPMSWHMVFEEQMIQIIML